MANLATESDRAVRTAVDAYLDEGRRPELTGEMVVETRNGRYRLIDGVLFAANDGALVGAELVGWLVESPRRIAVEPRFRPGARAVLVDSRRHRHIIVTSQARRVESDGPVALGGSPAPQAGSQAPQVPATTPPPPWPAAQVAFPMEGWPVAPALVVAEATRSIPAPLPAASPGAPPSVVPPMWVAPLPVAPPPPVVPTMRTAPPSPVAPPPVAPHVRAASPRSPVPLPLPVPRPPPTRRMARGPAPQAPAPPVVRAESALPRPAPPPLPVAPPRLPSIPRPALVSPPVAAPPRAVFAPPAAPGLDRDEDNLPTDPWSSARIPAASARPVLEAFGGPRSMRGGIQRGVLLR